MELPFKITISGSRSDGKVAISIKDVNSGVKFVEVYMEKEVFAHALFGVAEQKAIGEIKRDKFQYIGKYSHRKMLLVEDTLEHGNRSKESVLKLVKTEMKKQNLTDWNIYNSGYGSKTVLKDGKHYFSASLVKYLDNPPKK